MITLKQINKRIEKYNLKLVRSANNENDYFWEGIGERTLSIIKLSLFLPPCRRLNDFTLREWEAKAWEVAEKAWRLESPKLFKNLEHLK